ncbi:uncharacterized protein V1516DRAFT_514687 [Lipomyces oligophaga]|uniref:uncharacterized protein n=1 Tax=Lipomyces oligophaga TaxID=45792 RepID=UPI0034CE166F
MQRSLQSFSDFYREPLSQISNTAAIRSSARSSSLPYGLTTYGSHDSHPPSSLLESVAKRLRTLSPTRTGKENKRSQSESISNYFAQNSELIAKINSNDEKVCPDEFANQFSTEEVDNLNNMTPFLIAQQMTINVSDSLDVETARATAESIQSSQSPSKLPLTLVRSHDSLDLKGNNTSIQSFTTSESLGLVNSPIPSQNRFLRFSAPTTAAVTLKPTLVSTSNVRRKQQPQQQRQFCSASRGRPVLGSAGVGRFNSIKASSGSADIKSFLKPSCGRNKENQAQSCTFRSFVNDFRSHSP